MSRAFDESEYTDAVRGMKSRLRASAGKGAGRGKAGREPITSVAKVEQDRNRKNSIEKGNRAELEVAELFSRWSGEVVRRTPRSGGWSNARFGVSADLVCANPAFPFSVEVKNREGWVLDDLVTGVRREHDKSIVQWWRQTISACPKQSNDERALAKKPLLIFKRNRQPWLIMALRSVSPLSGAFFRLSLPPPEFEHADVSVMTLDWFLEHEKVPEGLKNHKRSKR